LTKSQDIFPIRLQHGFLYLVGLKLCYARFAQHASKIKTTGS